MNPSGDSPFLGRGETVLVGCEPAAPTSGYCSDFRGTGGPSGATLGPQAKEEATQAPRPVRL